MKRIIVRTRDHITRVSALVGSALLVGGGVAQAQGISYTLAPAASSLSWDKDLGLKNHSLYGGQASIDFERLISLQGYYLTNNKINTAVDRLGLNGDLADQLTNQRLEVRSMGANVIWKFWPGGVAPFIKTGGGVIELRADSGATSKHIVLNAGAGLRFGANAPLFLDVFAEDMMLRVDRYSLFNQGAAVIPVDPDANKLRHNFMIGAAVGVPLGRNTDDSSNDAENLRWGLDGASLTLEPFAGRMQFDSKGPDGLLRDQDLAGLRAGVDLGRYVGIRGFYWRGADKNFKRLESIQSWGGELQFRLNSSPGLTPFLLAGAAQLDFKQDDTTSTAQIGTDKSSLILGGGVAIPFGERFALNVAARDYLYGSGNGADSVSSPSDLRNNWMYSVGLRVSIAGKSGSKAAERTVDRERSLEARIRADSIRWVATREDARRMGMRGDSTARLVMMDSMGVLRDSTGRVINDANTRGRAPNTITVPVPTVGEFYVRYGTPQGLASTQPMLPGSPADSAAQRAAALNGMSAEDMRTIVRGVVREELMSQRGSVLGAGDSARMANMSAAEREDYMNRRIDSLVNARVNERMANVRGQTTTPQTVIVAPGVAAGAAPGTTVVEQPRPGNNYSWIGSDARGGLMVYSGLTVNGGTQLSIGGRFDLGQFGNLNSKIHFVPEIAFGAGSGGRSTMLVANAQYLFRKVNIGTNNLIQPHVIAGLGVLNFSDRVGSRDGLEGIINIGYGASIPLIKNAGNRAVPVLTVEHQGIDFFQLNRLLVGLSWRL